MALELFPTPSWPQPSFYIPLYSEIKKFPGKSDMAALNLQATESQAATSYWACDNQNLFFALEVPWPAEIQSWDDALVFTVSHHPDSPDCFTSLGFAGTGKHPRVMCICRNGSFLPKLDCSTIKFKLFVDTAKTLFTITVPWSLLQPLRPLLYEAIAVNLSIPRHTPEGRILYQLAEDKDYRSAGSRRFYHMGVDPRHFKEPCAQSYMTNNLWQGSKPVQINLGLYNPMTCPAKLEIAIKKGDSSLEAHSSTLELGSGGHHWTLRWSPQRPLPSGEYVLELSGHGCGKTFVKKHPFFVIDPAELSALNGDLLKLEADINCRYPEAVHTALGYLDWKEERCSVCSRGEKTFQDFLMAKQMRDRLHNGVNPLEDKPGLSRRSFRRNADERLSTYSLYLPRGYTLQRKWPLLMLLYDSDNLASNPELHKLADKLGLVLVFPHPGKGNGLLRDEDIMQNLAATKQSLPLDWDKVFIGGVAAGGRCAFRVGLGHPEHFSGLAVISGTPCQQFYHEGQKPHPCTADLPLVTPMLPILVVHGATDEATSQPMAELLAALREQGANPAYKEVPKAAKEGINWVPELYAWLKLQLNK